MSVRTLLVSSLVLPLTALGCGDNSHSAGPDAGAQVDSGTTPDAGAQVAPGFAVVNSDFASTSITLLDPTGKVANDHCLDSGTVPPGTTTALSGDVVLPGAPQPDRSIVAIDRTNAVLTWLDPADCKPRHQLDVSTGFMANPYDVVAVSATKAYVARYARNPKPSASATDFDDGDDLLIIDPSVPKITGRIDLAADAVAVAGHTIYARPDRVALVGTTLYVVLDNISDKFDAMGHGRIAIVDTTTDKVTGTIDLADLYNCGGLDYVASLHQLVVTCAGDYTTADPSLTSGLAYLDLAQSPPALVKEQHAAELGVRALGDTGIDAAGALGFAATAGVFGGSPKDQLWSFDVAAGKATKLVDGADSFIFGSVTVDSERKQVLLTDAGAAEPRVRFYDYASGTPTAKTAVDPDPQHHLPPRAVRAY